ncbi:MAG: alcohol dehydrogenase catalytic domain-containing protein [Streptomyces sp.]|nr:alcohol dehydrogenase catalytic domain-containing protein [Streptomyces sp.]
MKAGRISRFGGPQALEIVNVPTPRPRAGEVLVALRAAGVNRVDVVVREGAFTGAPMPLVLGAADVGEVAEIGPGVTEFSPGDRVVVNPFVACDECPAAQDQGAGTPRGNRAGGRRGQRGGQRGRAGGRVAGRHRHRHHQHRAETTTAPGPGR